MGQSDRVPVTGLLHLFVVYVVWGSTYLAIRIAVREDSGFPPFLLGASRTLAAAALLLAWNVLRRGLRLPTRSEWGVLVVSGLLMWVGGNGLVNWAEQRADSGYAALLVGTMPMWVALVEAVIDRQLPSPLLFVWLLVGFAGLFILVWPVLRAGARADAYSVVALILAPLWWGIGSILQTRRPVSLSPTASAAWQQLVGAAGFLLVALLAGETPPRPGRAAWMAWAYLVAAGSIVAFTSFLRALRLLPTRLVATYTYANPIIAVLLGWLVLHERITGWTAAGTALVFLGIAGTFRVRARGVENPLPTGDRRGVRSGRVY